MRVDQICRKTQRKLYVWNRVSRCSVLPDSMRFISPCQGCWGGGENMSSESISEGRRSTIWGGEELLAASLMPVSTIWFLSDLTYEPGMISVFSQKKCVGAAFEILLCQLQVEHFVPILVTCHTAGWQNMNMDGSHTQLSDTSEASERSTWTPSVWAGVSPWQVLFEREPHCSS